eukprot:Protomagalhaensia_sp_Gyna_25__1851@NODE_1981_length_1368_cov_14_777276_g1631_i0_p2_GENE_NODE_1981_length_1368_cov_14_777276_g1631_i0NODE_1981_length_1368_cov_14_777276_g1631_i0_p2_ORF_typecomplete_len205_score26_55TRAPP/PF04051_16/7_5e33PLDc_3/PF13918_6/0_17_NODE_1981_length_1368_cov_14_777276_g1631_i07521366
MEETSEDKRVDDERTILNQPLVKKQKQEVAVASLHFIFAAMVQYCMNQTRQAAELEDKLHEMGVRLGYRVLLLVSFREKNYKRETRILPMLTFITQNCWRYLFGYHGDLFRSQDSEGEYMINDKKFLLTRHTTAPRGEGFINCGAFGAGLIEGILCGAEFPASVAAHIVPDSTKGGTGRALTFFIRFVPEVLSRERKLAAGNSI